MHSSTEAPDSDVQRIRATAAVIKADMEADVRDFEGKPFNGKTVGEMHGNLAAGISALAGMVDRLLDVIDAAVESHREDAPHIYADGSTS